MKCNIKFMIKNINIDWSINIVWNIFSIIKELILMQFIYSFIFILYIFLSFFLIKLIYKDNLIIEENLTKIIESKNKFYCIINISNLILLLLSINVFKYTYISIFISIVVNIISTKRIVSI